MSCIGIGHYEIGRNDAAAGQFHSRGRTPLDADALHSRVQSHGDTMALHQRAQRSGDGAGAAHREEHAVSALEVVDEPVNAGGVEGVAADQQRLDREGLAQLVVLQVGFHQTPDGAIATQPDQARDQPKHRPEFVERLGRQLGEADVEDAFGVRQQPQVAVPVVRRDAPDFSQRIVQRAAIVEVIAIGKTEAVPRRQRNQLNVIGQSLAE